MMETDIDCQPQLKRRKVRKGTQSCWECKRRKIRCTFAAATKGICDGCRSRRAKCVSQAYHEGEWNVGSEAGKSDQVEALVEQVARDAGSKLLGLRHHDTQHPPNTKIVHPVSNVHALHSYEEISNSLLVAWPSTHDLELIRNVGIGSYPAFHGVVCVPYSKFLSKEMPSIKEILQLPPPGVHPVFIAHKLLLLGSLLQSVSPASASNVVGLSARTRDIMCWAVERASRLVTSNDDLITSLEGIECLMAESMYYNNAGNLRRAWLTNRRAMMFAQMTGLRLGKSTVLNAQTKERVEPEYMWFRLVTTDRYLSMMLGLPQGCQENAFARSKSLETFSALERMERMEADVGGLMLQRCQDDIQDTKKTLEIDKLLQEAAACMPAQWWLPDFDANTTSVADAFSQTIRLNLQFAHYHALSRLHLPYILHSDSQYDYNRTIAVSASREILLRFVRFCNSGTTAAYCRGIDFLAFIACTTVCLAHIQLLGLQDDSRSFLAHQRPANRGLMERTLQIMDIKAFDNDAIACKIVDVLRPLLGIEAAAFTGDQYSVSISSEQAGHELDGRVHYDGSTLSINVPHLGTIRLERDSAMRHGKVGHMFCVAASTSPVGVGNLSTLCSDWTEQQATWQGLPVGLPTFGELSKASQSDCAGGDERAQPTSSGAELTGLDDDSADTMQADVDDWTLQSVDTALFDSLFHGLGAVSWGGQSATAKD